MKSCCFFHPRCHVVGIFSERNFQLFFLLGEGLSLLLGSFVFEDITRVWVFFAKLLIYIFL